MPSDGMTDGGQALRIAARPAVSPASNKRTRIIGNAYGLHHTSPTQENCRNGRRARHSGRAHDVEKRGQPELSDFSARPGRGMKNLLAIDRNPVKMFSYFIRLICTAEGGCATRAF
jgi:hypothetical protein